jgi:Tol biopolymer transport system component
MSPPDQSIESRPLNNEENVGPQDIYLTNADGSDLVNLTQTPGADESSPVWSPNGREIAYLSSGSLWIISIDGADARKIADASGATPISWSPNSETIAFVDSDRLNVVDRDGGNLRELVFVIDLLVSASPWSPDSKRLTFSGRPAIILFPKETNLFEEEWERGEPGENIYAINIDGSGFVRLLSPSDVWVTLPSWSPDGKSITFNTYYALPGLIPPSGGNLVLLGNRGANSKDLTGTYPGRTLLWSSDSKSVVSEGDDGSIYEIDVSTDRVTSVLSRKLSPFTDAGKSIALSPTGDKIAFVSDRMIYVIDKNSGAQTALAEGASPAWSPDGKKIAFVHGVTFITLGMNKSFRNIEEDVGIRDGLKADYRDSVIRFR